MPEKRSPEGSEFNLGDDGQDESGNSRRRVVRTLGMPDDEWAARERRRNEFRAQMEAKREQLRESEERSNIPLEQFAGQDTDTTDLGADDRGQLPSPIAGIGEKKPWESLAIGNLGENLSHIERKDREIEQQKYIVQYHHEKSPHQVEHNMRILNRLMLEREQMEDSEENNMSQDRREEPERVRRRLEVLRWALSTSRFEDERINIEAAINAYESGRIPYSHSFTLIYAGNIVDTCPTYRSFCVDREARLDRYYIAYGPGWLWQEPPLAGPRNDGLAKKGVCLERDFHSDRYGIGTHPVTLEFEVQRDNVSKLKPKRSSTPGGERREQGRSVDASCQFSTLLDSGASFPILLQSDFARLNIDLANYAAQGAMDLQIVGGEKMLKFYEMFVSVCTKEGHSIVGAGNDAVWPGEQRTLGGFFPVLAMDDPPNASSYFHRLSGMVPFDVCYMSSAPGTGRIWIGEDRRDVLGTSRLPAHLRFDSDKVFALDYPREFETLRKEARTPDRVIFLHEFPKEPGILLTDSDTLGTRGKSELAIGRYQTEKKDARKQASRKVIPHRVVQIEPRKGNIKTLPKYKPRPWQADFE